MHFNISEEPLYTDIYRKNARPQNRGPHFVRACAVEMRFNISLENFLNGILQENAAAQNLGPHFARVCAVEMHFNISQQQLFTEIYRKSLGTEARTTLRASLRSRNALQHFTTATFTEIFRKNVRPQNQGPHFVRACAVEIHFNISQEQLFTEIYRKNAWPQNLGPHFVRARAVEMHVDNSQEPPYTEIYGINARAQSEHPDQAPAFTPSVRTPQCGHTVWGKKNCVGFCNQLIVSS